MSAGVDGNVGGVYAVRGGNPALVDKGVAVGSAEGIGVSVGS